MSIAFADGRSGDMISAFDLGITRGEGAFETLLVVREKNDFTVLQFDDHLKRLERSLLELGLKYDGNIVMDAAYPALKKEFAAHPDETEFTLRLFVSAGLEHDNRTKPLAWATVAPKPDAVKNASQDGVDVMVLSKGHPADFASGNPWALQGVKSISYAPNMATLRYAKMNGFDDAIYTTSEGYILEAPTSNVVMLKGKTLCTPDPELGLLHGTTQQSIYRAAEGAGYSVEYGKYTLQDLAEADAAWLTSSIRLFTPIKSLDKKPMKNLDKAHAFHDTMKKWILKI